MNVLIANANKDIFTEIDPKLKFIESTVNTSIFKVSPTRFEKIRSAVREKGYNPFALMAW